MSYTEKLCYKSSSKQKMTLVFFDITIGGSFKGRIVFRLFDTVVPRTALNFKCLCTGEKGIGKTTGKPLHYENTIIHRVIPGFMCQGGDFSMRNGTGGESIFGGKFQDEAFSVNHNRAGLLSMANAGKNTNGSQFFITFAAAPHLDGKHVVFGELVEGMDVLRSIEKVDTDGRDKPVIGQDVIIRECGIHASKSSAKAEAPRLMPTTNPSSDESDSRSDDSARHHKKHKKGKSRTDKKEKKIKKKHKKKKSKSHKKKDTDSETSSQSELSNKLLSDGESAPAAASSNVVKDVEKSRESTAYVGADGITYKGRGKMRLQETSRNGDQHHGRFDKSMSGENQKRYVPMERDYTEHYRQRALQDSDKTRRSSSNNNSRDRSRSRDREVQQHGRQRERGYHLHSWNDSPPHRVSRESTAVDKGRGGEGMWTDRSAATHSGRNKLGSAGIRDEARADDSRSFDNAPLERRRAGSAAGSTHSSDSDDSSSRDRRRRQRRSPSL